MDGASRAFAAPVRHTIGGKDLEVRGTLAENWAELEQEYLKRRPNPLEVAKENIALFEDQPELQNYLLKMAFDKACQARSAMMPEINEWLNTIDGSAFLTWLSVRHNDPELTPAKVKDMLMSDIESEVDALIKSLGVTEATEADMAKLTEHATKAVVGKTHDAVEQAGGGDWRGNSTGPPPPEAETAGDINLSPGDESSESSPKSSTGPQAK